MLHPQNGDRIVTVDSVTSLHPVYRKHRSRPSWTNRPWPCQRRGTNRRTVAEICCSFVFDDTFASARRRRRRFHPRRWHTQPRCCCCCCCCCRRCRQASDCLVITRRCVLHRRSVPITAYPLFYNRCLLPFRRRRTEYFSEFPT